MATSPRKSPRKHLQKNDETAGNRVNIPKFSNKDKRLVSTRQRDLKSQRTKRNESEELNVASENFGDDDGERTREMTKEEIARENLILLKAEEKMKELKIKIEQKEIICHKLLLELKRMTYIFNKVKEIEIGMAATEKKDETKMEGRLTFEERKEILDKGPHNLIFHGVTPDWIETHELILDDPDFIKDVDPIGQRIRSLIREECGIARDVGIIDCYRYFEGLPYEGVYPIVVQFKARREKEQLLWRSKDRLRKINVIVTDDIAHRQKGAKNVHDKEHASPFDQACPPPRQQQQQPDTSSSNSNKKILNLSPSKKMKQKRTEVSAEQSLFGDFF